MDFTKNNWMLSLHWVWWKLHRDLHLPLFHTREVIGLKMWFELIEMDSLTLTYSCDKMYKIHVCEVICCDLLEITRTVEALSHGFPLRGPEINVIICFWRSDHVILVQYKKCKKYTYRFFALSWTVNVSYNIKGTYSNVWNV